MTSTNILILVLATVVVVQLVGIIVAGRRRRRLCHLTRSERTRSFFAEIRNDAWEMARAGQIDIASRTFQALNFMTTIVVRRPDQYEEIASTVGACIMKQKLSGAQSSSLASEAPTWTPEVRQIAQRVSDGLVLLARDYSLRFRLSERALVALEKQLARARQQDLAMKAAQARAHEESRALERIGAGTTRRQLQALTAAAAIAAAAAVANPAPARPVIEKPKGRVSTRDSV